MGALRHEQRLAQGASGRAVAREVFRIALRAAVRAAERDAAPVVSWELDSCVDFLEHIQVRIARPRPRAAERG
jgi:hypothetical protein